MGMCSQKMPTELLPRVRCVCDDVRDGSWLCENALAEALTTRDFGEVAVFGHLAMFGGLSVENVS
jgi:hypothetical protein